MSGRKSGVKVWEEIILGKCPEEKSSVGKSGGIVWWNVPGKVCE